MGQPRPHLAIALAAVHLASPAPAVDAGARSGNGPPDVLTLAPDLVNPPVATGEPGPGRMVLQWLPDYAGTRVAHALYLPTDWVPGHRYPVIIEYRGNTARVGDPAGIGYGISGGSGFIWAVLPFVSQDRQRDEDWWWGDVGATVAYAKEAVPAICRQWGGDPAAVVLVGYSRGAIACNYIGLHDDAIARLWRAMVPFSHYDDGHVPWGMTAAERADAPARLWRLGRIPQYVCGEHCSIPQPTSDAALRAEIAARGLATFAAAQPALGLLPITAVEGTRRFIAEHHPRGDCTIVDLPWINHTSQVILRDTPERRRLREWLGEVLRRPPPDPR